MFADAFTRDNVVITILREANSEFDLKLKFLLASQQAANGHLI
jgi:hypothetical protein